MLDTDVIGLLITIAGTLLYIIPKRKKENHYVGNK